MLRAFRRLDHEAQRHKQEEANKAAQAGKKAPGQAPSEEAKKDYMTYRKKRIEQIETQRKKRKTFLDRQALERQEEYKRRMHMLASRKPLSPKHKRRRHVRQKPVY